MNKVACKNKAIGKEKLLRLLREKAESIPNPENNEQWEIQCSELRELEIALYEIGAGAAS